MTSFEAYVVKRKQIVERIRQVSCRHETGYYEDAYK